MNKDNRGQDDDLKFKGKRKPTNLEARLEEARALRKKALAEREQRMIAASDSPKPEASVSLAAGLPTAASMSVSQPVVEHKHAPSAEPFLSVDVESQRANPPVEVDRRRSRVAERLALGLGIGLGIGTSFYLGASLFGDRIGFVSAEAPNSAEQPQQVALNFPPIEASKIVSPTYVSQVEPETLPEPLPESLDVSIPSENEQGATNALTPLEQSAADSSSYEMAPKDVNPEVALTPLPGPDEPLPDQVLEASLNADELNVDPSALPALSDAVKPDIVEIAPSEAQETETEPASLPKEDVAKEVFEDPILAAIAEAGVTEEPPADPEAEILAEPDLRLPGAEAFTVVLNAPNTLSQEEVTRVTEDIVDTGASIDKVSRVNFRISANQVRFFRAADAAPAAAIAERIGAEARDFTDYRPTPPVGRIEMFLASAVSKPVETIIEELPVTEEVAPEKRAAKLYQSNDNR